MSAFDNLPREAVIAVRISLAQKAMRHTDFASEDGSKLTFAESLKETLVNLRHLAQKENVSIWSLLTTAEQQYEREKNSGAI